MNLLAEKLPDALLIRVEEVRIDAAVAIQFKDQMRDLIDAVTTRIVLDLSQVTFLDSSGLGAVVAVMKHLGPSRKLELAGLTPPVGKVFRLTRMDSVFTIHAEASAALAAGSSAVSAPAPVPTPDPVASATLTDGLPACAPLPAGPGAASPAGSGLLRAG